MNLNTYSSSYVQIFEHSPIVHFICDLDRKDCSTHFFSMPPTTLSRFKLQFNWKIASQSICQHKIEKSQIGV